VLFCRLRVGLLIYKRIYVAVKTKGKGVGDN